MVIAKGITAGEICRSRWFVPESCIKTIGTPAQKQAPKAVRWSGLRNASRLSIASRRDAMTTNAMNMLTPWPSRHCTTELSQRIHVAGEGGPRELRTNPRAYSAYARAFFTFNTHQGPASKEASPAALSCEATLGMPVCL